MTRILEDDRFTAQLREGCKAVADSLSWSEPLTEMESLYREVISERRSS